MNEERNKSLVGAVIIICIMIFVCFVYNIYLINSIHEGMKKGLGDYLIEADVENLNTTNKEKLKLIRENIHDTSIKADIAVTTEPVYSQKNFDYILSCMDELIEMNESEVNLTEKREYLKNCYFCIAEEYFMFDRDISGVEDYQGLCAIDLRSYLAG